MDISTGDGANKVNGNGNVLTQDRQITSFDKIEIQGVFNVYLSQGDIESVKVETDENIQPLIITSVEDNVLKLKMRDSTSIGKMKKINIYINVVHLSKLNTEGVGKLACLNKLNIDDLELNCKGVGATSLNLSGEKLSVKSEIVGALMLSGNVKEVTINHSGVGVIEAYDLKTESMNLDADGIGTAEVYASKQLTISTKGLGGVKYKGHPEVKNIRNDGIGKIVEVD